MRGSGFALVLAAATAAIQSSPARSAVIADIDLSRPFAARSAWHFTAAQASPVSNPFDPEGEKLPGAITLCLGRRGSAACDPVLRNSLRAATPDELFSEPHTLNTARLVRPSSAAAEPLLLVQTSSLHSGDGDQLVLTQAMAYRHDLDRFVSAYEHLTGRNNNQEVRYIDSGALSGAIVSVEPTENAPFAFWVAVSTYGPTHAYRQVLRYRSATRYADANPLAVIDSEMPNIERHLGLRRAGSPLPLPAGPCKKPHLIGLELWCQGRLAVAFNRSPCSTAGRRSP